ncbi:hypothetical protein SSP35_02_03440 [Streptomyces sp. NBRC 110611]|uniref:MmpS family transport accessory protein n=1 Tax=Streptomyces sp. NBRC 110611 TaxID=1621259 RepID=UPI0008330E9A|nr:MmpS family transport accessory protein [Streptomyces sp. NBRC 110611]GAU65975.1 hypothetical protein SSP35_02_03440 [Streptomyces sp. NBRC 110611]
MRRATKIVSITAAAGLAATWLTGCAGDVKSEFDKLDAKEFEVVYEVTGSGVQTITYEEGGKGELSSKSVDDPKVPWKKEITMTGVATSPNVSLILGEKGGQADCVITINGKEAKRATAKGGFGTASCVAASPAGTSS